MYRLCGTTRAISAAAEFLSASHIVAELFFGCSCSSSGRRCYIRARIGPNVNPFIPILTLFLIVAKMNLPKRARVPECQKIKNGRLDQYGTEHLEV